VRTRGAIDSRDYNHLFFVVLTVAISTSYGSSLDIVSRRVLTLFASLVFSFLSATNLFTLFNVVCTNKLANYHSHHSFIIILTDYEPRHCGGSIQLKVLKNNNNKFCVRETQENKVATQYMDRMEPLNHKNYETWRIHMESTSDA